MSTAPTNKRPVPVGVFFAVFMVVFTLVFGISVVYTAMLPKSYRGIVIIEVRQKNNGERKLTGLGYDLAKNEAAIISSEILLRKVIADLSLNEKWGKKYFAGQTLKTWESLDIFKKRIIASPIPETTLVAIGIYDDDPKDAALLANAVATNYVTYVATNSPDLESQIVDNAHANNKPIHPKVVLNTIIGAVIGVILGMVAGIVYAVFVYKRTATN